MVDCAASMATPLRYEYKPTPRLLQHPFGATSADHTNASTGAFPVCFCVQRCTDCYTDWYLGIIFEEKLAT